MSDLILDIARCRGCRLSQYRTLAVPGELGAAAQHPLLAFIAEAPGADEDKVGRPMVGQAGKLLAEILQAAGVRREAVLITNTVRCRPPRNRLVDFPEASAACHKWTIAELQEYNPQAVVLLGVPAARLVFGKNPKMQEIHGVFRQTGPESALGTRLWTATWHPAAALHAPDRRATILQQMVDDIRRAAECAKYAPISAKN